ncbi:MAG TPA: hypothetical protein VFF67_03895 [Thermoplasmata archaeon]|nr:hypothetical protein [Thermoplasmata archaeon]
MTARAALSEDAEREERDERDRRRSLEVKYRDLRSRRQLLLDQVHKLVDEQKAIFDRQEPKRRSLDGMHAEYRGLGGEIALARRDRDAARRAADEALIAVRVARSELPRGELPNPDHLKREIAALELKQQTSALSIADENLLIDRIRGLQKRMTGLEKDSAGVAAKQARVKEAEEKLRVERAKVEHCGSEMTRLKALRDQRMASMRGILEEVGQHLAELRARSEARGELMRKVYALSEQLDGVDREIRALDRGYRARRDEARKTIREFTRDDRRETRAEEIHARVADQQLEELLKRGRITLGG